MYYIAKIEEIHVGLVLYRKVSGEMLQAEVEVTVQNIKTILESIKDWEYYFVPFLDEAQIISLGFEKTSEGIVKHFSYLDLSVINSVMPYRIKKVCLYFDFGTNYKVRICMVDQFGVVDKFDGVVKSKHELKTILKQLQIL